MNFLLWQFEVRSGHRSGTIITRGRTREEAAKFVEMYYDSYESFDYCRIDSAYLYSTNHPFDWLTNAPIWVDPTRKLVPNDYNFRNRFFDRSPE